MRRLRVLMLLLFVALTACSAGGTVDTQPKGEPPAAQSASVSSAPASPSAKVTDAKWYAAQYDYDRALATLNGDDSEFARQARAEIETAKANAVPWADNSTVSHIFYHSLIVDPERAFAPSEPTRKGFAEYMVTMSEFEAQLKQIYANGYVLIHPQRLMAKGPDGVMAPQPISLPAGKKPLVLSIDDVSYYDYMAKAGFANKLILKPDGRITNTYTDPSGKVVEGSYDIPTIVDDFVAKHPDFSYRGDKGTMAMTGYEGVLGYRSSVQSYGDNEKTRAEAAEAKKVADVLKASGWRFASHSWGHLNVYKDPMGRLTWDQNLWDAEVKPILGATDAYIFPFGTDGYGSRKIDSVTSQYQFLVDDGFSYFFPIDSTKPYWTDLRPNMWRQMRIGVDGTSMAMAAGNPNNPLWAFFDVTSTIDPARAQHGF